MYIPSIYSHALLIVCVSTEHFFQELMWQIGLEKSWETRKQNS